MTGTVSHLPDRSVILIDSHPLFGYEVEPLQCPAASGKGRAFCTFAQAFEYAEALAIEANTSTFIMCDVPEDGEQ